MSEPAEVLFIEDEPSLAESVKYNLELEGYRVRLAASGSDGLAQFTRTTPDLVLLDLMLPEMSGLDVCRMIRSRSDVPIIMVTARSSEGDVVAGLELGADDYVTKPFSMRELISRVKANLRRASLDDEEEIVSGGPVSLNVTRHEVTVAADVVPFRPKEFDILELLMRNQGRLVTRERIIDQVWGADYFGDTKTLDVHVKRIRSKIETDPRNPQYLVTVRGLGYKFADA